jgi:putative membrane protein
LIDEKNSGSALKPLGLASFVPRGLVGGTLMGLANLVPGISGGTMLLAAGVYPTFINAIADITTLRFDKRSLVVLATIGGAAVLAIGLLAGPTRTLVIEERPLMYSFFIGLTLGGLPLVRRLAQPVNRSVWAGAAVAFIMMVVMSLGAGSGAASEGSIPLLVLSGLAGASAMILPGISGGYLLLLLGQYEPILGAIDLLKRGLIGTNGFDLALILDSMGVVVPVGIGVVIGIVGVSNALRWLLERFEKATLGVLLGLLLGAVVGLYPFQEAVPPEPGFAIHGVPVPLSELADVPADDWPLARFAPAPKDLAISFAVAALGLLITAAIARFGQVANGEDERDETHGDDQGMHKEPN